MPVPSLSESCFRALRIATADTSVPQLTHIFECGLSRTGAVCDAVTIMGKLDLPSHPSELVALGREALRFGCAGRELDAVQCARSNVCLWNEAACAHEACRGEVDLLQRVRAERGAFGESICALATRGHLDMFYLARGEGCP